jgi:hypothetical protein
MRRRVGATEQHARSGGGERDRRVGEVDRGEQHGGELAEAERLAQASFWADYLGNNNRSARHPRFFTQKYLKMPATILGFRSKPVMEHQPRAGLPTRARTALKEGMK